jgi:hypothetical protein
MKLLMKQSSQGNSETCCSFVTTLCVLVQLRSKITEWG